MHVVCYVIKFRSSSGTQLDSRRFWALLPTNGCIFASTYLYKLFCGSNPPGVASISLGSPSALFSEPQFFVSIFDSSQNDYEPELCSKNQGILILLDDPFRGISMVVVLNWSLNCQPTIFRANHSTCTNRHSLILPLIHNFTTPASCEKIVSEVRFPKTLHYFFNAENLATFLVLNKRRCPVWELFDKFRDHHKK